MAGHQSIGLTLVSPESVTDNSDRLWIVQPVWPENADAGFLSWVTSTGQGLSLGNLGQMWGRYKSHCSEVDASLEVEIQIHRSRTDLDYVATASYGELAAGVLQFAEIKESVAFKGEAEKDMERLFVGNLSGAWEGPVYDLAGNRVEPPPTVQLDGSKLVAALPVVGSLRLSATIEYYLHILTIQPRTEGEYDPADRETAYQSTVMAIYSGQVESHEVDLPDMSGNCQGGFGVRSGDDDDDDGPCKRRVIYAHPCTQKKIDEWLEDIPCPGEESS